MDNQYQSPTLLTSLNFSFVLFISKVKVFVEIELKSLKSVCECISTCICLCVCACTGICVQVFLCGDDNRFINSFACFAHLQISV